MQPDYSEVMAIESLVSVLPKWKAWSDAAKKIPILKEAEYPFPDVSPKFLGYVIQKYRPRGGSAPSATFQDWIDQIEAGIVNRLLPALDKADMLLPEERYAAASFEPHLPLLQMIDFNSLIARSQEHQAPVFELADSQLKQGGVVLEATKESMYKSQELFSQAAERVIKIIG